MPDSGTVDANATGRTTMTNKSGNVRPTSLHIQSGKHNSSLLPPATGIKVSISEISLLLKCTKERKGKRAPQKSEILSFSLCKRDLKAKQHEKLKGKTRKTERLKHRKKFVGGRLKIDAEKPSTSKRAPSPLAEIENGCVSWV
jgi:hypothetical protein